MRDNRYSSKNLLFIKIYSFLVLILFLIVLAPVGAVSIYYNNYLINAVNILITLYLLILYSNKKGFNAFEPIYIISAVYVMMYFITPIYDILTENYYWFGYHLFPYGVKSSVIAMLGYISFFIIYTFNIKQKHSVVKSEQKSEQNKILSKPLLLTIILLMYGGSFLANIWYLVNYYGGDLLYFITLGVLGSYNESLNNTPIGFISMLSYSLPTATLLYWEFGKSKFLKVILFLPMMMLQVSRGFRFFVIQIVIIFFSYFYIRTGKKINPMKFFLVILTTLIPIIFMTLYRDAIRFGEEIQNINFNWDIINEALDSAIWDNFRIYQNFYGMVNAIPSHFSFVYGRQIIVGTLVMVVPRVIWPGKISTYGGVGLQTLIGPRIAGGQAYPNIGEFYYAMGITGVVILMGLYGYWMKRVTEKYMDKSNGPLSNMIFSIILATNLQLIIRGYTPSNFWFIIFSLLPIWVINFLTRTRFK